jgi:hypothetical protein
MEKMLRLCVMKSHFNSVDPIKFVIDPCTGNKQDRDRNLNRIHRIYNYKLGK